jgi:hypothetical protein
VHAYKAKISDPSVLSEASSKAFYFCRHPPPLLTGYRKRNMASTTKLNIKILLLKSNWFTLLVASTLNKIKIKVTINTATCFGSRRNHPQGVPQCLAKATYMVFVHVDGDVVNGMAVYQPVVLVCVLCGGRMKTLGDSLKMVPTWTETCCSIYCDFNYNFI